MRVCAAAIAILVSSPALAKPSGGPPVHMLVRECEGVVETEVERVLAAELGAETNADDQAQDPTWIVARCTGSRVVIEVSDGISRKTLRRSFELGAAPAQARGRLIAIAGSELVLAGWAELAVRPKLRVEPEGDAPSAEHLETAAQRAKRGVSIEERAVEQSAELAATSESEPPGEERPRAERKATWFALQPPERRLFRIMPLGSVRGFFGHDGLLKGGGLRLGEERLVGSGWAVDALVESGSIDSFRIDSYTLGAELYVYASSHNVTGRAGAGLRAGLATATPSEGDPPPEPSSSPTPWGWPMLALSMTFGASRGPVFELSAEGGYVTLPVAEGRYGISIRGPWFGLQAGIGFAP
jgi:hypothetical protein